MRIFGNRVIAIKSEPCLFKSAIRNSQSAISSGVWCNASIRVLGTRGDSSILSSPTKKNCGFRIANCGLIGLSQPTRPDCPFSNPQSEFRNPQSFYAPVAQMEEHDASNVEAAGSSPARSSTTFLISDFRFAISLWPAVRYKHKTLGRGRSKITNQKSKILQRK